MKRNTNASRKTTLHMMHRNDRKGIAQAVRKLFAGGEQLALPMLDLITDAKATIEVVLGHTNRALIELILRASAQELAGPKTPGRRSGQVRWYGEQPGRVRLGERSLHVMRPRLRTNAGEVPVMAYERLKQDPALGSRMHRILVAGVSMRDYARVLPEMADTVGVSKSAVSRRFIDQAEAALARLMERDFKDVDIVAVYIDGIQIAGHHIVAALGLDAQGDKHILGLVRGSTENAAVVKDLLDSLVKRGIKQDKKRLFVLDGSKALRAGIIEVYGDAALVQRCRTHKIRNVLERIGDERVRTQTAAVMRAAYEAPQAKVGMAKLKTHAGWLKTEHADAAASLLEGLEEMFTVNRLGLTPLLVRSLASTNIIENPNGRVRRVTHRVCRWRDAEMAKRWAAVGFLEAERRFHRIQGHRDLWILAQALGRESKTSVAQSKKAA